MMRLVAAIFGALAASVAVAGGSSVQLDRAPLDLNDKLSLQRGAQVFVNHCLNCHSATLMRYSRLTDLGLTEAQIRENLLFTSDKVGDPMRSALNAKDGKAWFGVLPPDLSLTARSRGPDWLYTYLRSFYRDPASKTGWNNTAFPNVSMPHVLWEYQGDAVLKAASKPGAVGQLVIDRPGRLSPAEYDRYVADLVNYLAFMGEPARTKRVQIGILVIFFLAVFFVIALFLKKEFWKDVR